MAIERARTRVQARSPRLRVECRQNQKGALELVGGFHSDQAGWLTRLQDLFASRGTDFAMSQLNRLIAACRNSEGKIDNSKLNGLIAFVEGAAPQNEVQAALAVQMALTHNAAQTMLERTLRADQIPQFDCANNSAVKLLRTFIMQAETLAKLQRGGEQVVKVVHVHPGAQAIVANVVSTGTGNSKGGGGSDEKWNQPHAKAEMPAERVERMPEVWCEDTERKTLPFAIGQG